LEEVDSSVSLFIFDFNAKLTSNRMLVNFFQLNPASIPANRIMDQADFESALGFSTGLTNQIYWYSKLGPTTTTTPHRTLKINKFTFTNFSFSKTEIVGVMFNECVFEDCLFVGVTLKNCEFHNCVFKEVNTHKIVIKDCYIDPASFKHAVKGYKYANIGIHLFQQLLQNSKERSQRTFERHAEYHFKKWNNKVLLMKYRLGQPYKLSFGRFFPQFVGNSLLDFIFGYGLRFRNFALTFVTVFVFFWALNFKYWNAFAFDKKDLKIESFSPDSANIISSGLYTLDVTTKLVDSQFQPTSSVGMYWLAAESICAFILLSALVTLILNRFVK
jgi:hypothetical protein